MEVSSGCSSSVSTLLQPPHPKPPLEYPDLYGKRRQLAKVQILEREIGFLKEELKSIDGLQPASRCCKEVADFVEANTDPLVPASRKIQSSCRFWKLICSLLLQLLMDLLLWVLS
ncbi:guanine nucleotide-binding protein subunit gamma 3-like isoform X2 [Cornus florida]|uniref:guanine nucleotide-binding protein subunit gamma 3-like isoform X2 n=1 Tax=Cornus florida TaxID=4283 RepID=UPI0028A0401B|nr:guanine nucleotide-binding protein subunit gamma 3-like isoform X2 [Cornus florida]